MRFLRSEDEWLESAVRFAVKAVAYVFADMKRLPSKK
jgi:hypothetical protein